MSLTTDLPAAARAASTPPPATPPLPTVTPLTRPFWDACGQHRLRLQRCEACNRLRFYPAESCPHCGTLGGRWVDVSGRGTLYSWIVVRKSPDAYWRTRLPYVSAIVELDEQPQLYMPGLLETADADALRAGAALEVGFSEPTPGRWLPHWRLATPRR